MVNRFTQKAQSALQNALSTAKNMGHGYVGSEHLLLGILEEADCIAARILTMHSAEHKRLQKAIIDYMGTGAPSSITSADMTPRLREIIESASYESSRTGGHFVGTEHLLSALLNRRECVAVKLLESDGVALSDVKSELAAYIGTAPSKYRSAGSEEDSKKVKKNSLLAFSKDLTEAAIEGRTDPVLCRDSETERLIRILCRRQKNNPCLIGEPGVGKTAVVEGLAERIARHNVPPELDGKRILTLDLPSMLAGAKYRGEFEDRIKNVIEEAKKDPDIILFVDEMHIMVGAGSAEGAIDASNILKPALSRGEIRMIGATTPAEYRAQIEKDAAFERRFQPLRISEPSEEDAERMLFGVRKRYEAHHKIEISDEAIHAAVRLSVRYINDRFLPDKALDLIDEASARLRLCTRSTPLLHKVGSTLSEQKEEAILEGNLELALKISQQEKEEEKNSSVICLEDNAATPILTADDIANVISEQTGIPCRSLLEGESAALRELERALEGKIIGQGSAIRAVANAVKRGRMGLAREHKPICSFLFLGESGVGKSALCQALADSLFESRDALVKFDMSEYSEGHSVAKLIGAPPGYVGYKDGGLLTQRIRRQPYCVLLFDEIEKAHPDVYDLLLQILEDGRLTDSDGRECDFSNCIVIMTSNILTARDISKRKMGFFEDADKQDRTDLTQNAKLREYFRPEFINRIDEIILFDPLGISALERIAQGFLRELCERAERLGILLVPDSDIAYRLAERVGTSHFDLGARPLRREVTTLIETPLSEFLLESNIMPHPDTSIQIRIHFKNECAEFEKV